MTKEYRVFYDEYEKRFRLCGNQKKCYDDEIPVMITKSLAIAEYVQSKLNRNKGENK